LIVFGLLAPAHAVLIDRGTGMIYDTDFGITWLQDAAYSVTSGYATDQRMAWSDAVAWADQLDYGGYEDWRLPRAIPVDGGTDFHINSDGAISYDGSTDKGYNIYTSELSHLFYVSLGNVGYYTNDGSINENYGLKNTGIFINLLPGTYWTGTDAAPVPSNPSWYMNNAWYSAFHNGIQDGGDKDAPYYAWAVRDGDIGPSASVNSPFYTTMLLGQSISFDYLWLMGEDPPPYSGQSFDVLALQGGAGWQ
jgi:hypothetical protein